MTNYFETLEPGCFYHVFNKTVGNELMFRTDTDYHYFTQKIKRFILPIADIYTYCLMPTHFHLMVKIKEGDQDPVEQIKIIQRGFSNFFNSYSKSYNIAHKRTGKLFNLPYRRIKVLEDSYFSQLICYIHRNPVHHNISTNYEEYLYSSYRLILSADDFIKYNEVFNWFGGKKEFIEFHRLNINEYLNTNFYLE